MPTPYTQTASKADFLFSAESNLMFSVAQSVAEQLTRQRFYYLYNGIPCQCPDCQSSDWWDADWEIRWVNQHGTCIRVWCKECLQIVDRTVVKGRGEKITIIQAKGRNKS